MTSQHANIELHYMEWNRRTAAHFLYGRQRGSPVFLSFDADAAALIADEIPGEDGADPTARFLTRVRDMCVFANQVNLARLAWPADTAEPPTGVAFLAAMVLAAHQMKDDDQATDAAYFLRLGALLGTTTAPRAGILTGAEEPLWEAWNRYLTVHGYLVTAQPGAGPTRFLQYARSQAVLRETDKESLRAAFRDRHVSASLDGDQLGFWLREQTWNRRYLREGFTHADPHRRAEFYRAAHEVYQFRLHAGAQPAHSLNVALRSRAIEAGLYREMDQRGRASYQLFPRQPDRFAPRPLWVVLEGAAPAPLVLRALRPGFYRPVARQLPFVDEPLNLPVVGDPRVPSMLFPKRDFWVLTEDPEDPAGAYATWSRYVDVGQRFFLLCRPGKLVDEVRRLRSWKDLNNQPLLDWTEDAERDGVHEFAGCMVLSYELRAMTASPGCQELLEALMPRSTVSVAVSGGLRDPNELAWLEGFPPTVKAYGFGGRIVMSIMRADGATQTITADVGSQEPYALKSSLAPGVYLVEAVCEGVVARRLVRIIAWDDVTGAAEVERVWNKDPLMAAPPGMCGASVLPYDDRAAEDTA